MDFRRVSGERKVEMGAEVASMRLRGETWGRVAEVLGVERSGIARRLREAGIYDDEEARGRLRDRMRDQLGDVAELAIRRLEEKLVLGEEAISVQQLAVVAGISVDKLAVLEGWKGEREDSAARWMDRLGEILSRPGTRFEVSLESGAREAFPGEPSEVIDVEGVDPPSLPSKS